MKKRFSGPQIVAKLRQADILIGQGKNVPEVCKEIEISQQTYYRRRQKYGGITWMDRRSHWAGVCGVYTRRPRSGIHKQHKSS